MCIINLSCNFLCTIRFPPSYLFGYLFLGLFKMKNSKLEGVHLLVDTLSPMQMSAI